MTRDEILQALASAKTHKEQIALVAELDALDHARRTASATERSLDWADTTVKATLAPGRTLDRHTAATDWLAEADLSAPGNHHQAVIAEASLWFGRLDEDVKADAAEFAEQARGMARRTAGKYGEQADEAMDAYLQYVAFLNREVLAASGLPQIQQRVDAFENNSPTPLPTEVFDNFAPPIHPINQGVDGQQTNSLAEGAEEAIAQSGGAPGAGRPSEHPEGQEPVSQAAYPPSSAKQGSQKVAGMLERLKDSTARQGHAMSWTDTQGADAWMGQCNGCGSSVALNMHGVTAGNAHTTACTNRHHAMLGSGPSVAIGYQQNLHDFLRAEAERTDTKDHSGWADTPDASGEQEVARENGGEDPDYVQWAQNVNRKNSKAGGAAPFVREAGRGDEDPPGKDEPKPNADREDEDARKPWEKEAAKREAASGLDQVQQVSDSFENPRPTSLPEDVMFPITQDWPEESTGGSNTGTPSSTGHQASLNKQADTWSGGDTPKAVPGGQDPVYNRPETTPPRADSGDFNRGVQQGQADAAKGDKPSFADNSSGTSDFVQGYVQGYGTGPKDSLPQDVPASMGGDSGQAQNAAEVAARTEKPLVMASKTPGMTVSAALVTRDVSSDSSFLRGYLYGRRWKEGDQLVAMGSAGEEAGIYAGITDNPDAQRAWVTAHREQSGEYPELTKRLRQHRLVTANFAKRNEDALIKGLYVQASTSLDLDTMSPVTSPSPQGATPSEGPGTIPELRDAPGTPAAPGGASPYNGAEPYGAPVVPDPLIQDLNAPPAQPQSPDAVHIQGDTSLSKSPQSMAFRKLVQANKLALRQKKGN